MKITIELAVDEIKSFFGAYNTLPNKIISKSKIKKTFIKSLNKENVGVKKPIIKQVNKKKSNKNKRKIGKV